ncbi:hypothetical protein P7K49_039401, partial [Saguinus oedipus]
MACLPAATPTASPVHPRRLHNLDSTSSAAAQHPGLLTVDQPGPAVESMQSMLILRPVMLLSYPCTFFQKTLPFGRSRWKLTWAGSSLPWLVLCGGRGLWADTRSRAAGRGTSTSPCCVSLWQQQWQQLSGFLWCKQEARPCQN